MTRFVVRYLNLTTLHAMGGRYAGLIAEVVASDLHNRFRGGAVQREPVITFADGWRLVPNLQMRHVLIDHLGAETDDWIGRTLVVSLCPLADRKTGAVTGRWQKVVSVRDDADPDAPWTPEPDAALCGEADDTV